MCTKRQAVNSHAGGFVRSFNSAWYTQERRENHCLSEDDTICLLYDKNRTLIVSDVLSLDEMLQSRRSICSRMSFKTMQPQFSSSLRQQLPHRSRFCVLIQSGCSLVPIRVSQNEKLQVFAVSRRVLFLLLHKQKIDSNVPSQEKQKLESPLSNCKQVV